MLREIFLPKTKEVIGGCRKLDNEEIHNLYSSANRVIILKLQKIRLEGGGGGRGYKAWMAGKRQEYKICTDLKTRGKRQYVKTGLKRKKILKYNFKKVECENEL